MGKKENRKNQKISKKKSKIPIGWIVAGIIATFLVAGPTGFDLFNMKDYSDGRSQSVNGEEQRVVLDPSMFPNGRVSSAYAMAGNYPDAMNQVFCYCYCDRPPTNHKSLLSCFATTHGSS